MKQQQTAPGALLARLAERGGLLSPAQIAACQQASEERRASGEDVDLAQVAQEEGLLSDAQAQALRNSTRRRTALYCATCERPFAVLGLPPGKTLPCPKCEQPLTPRADQQTTQIKDGRSPGAQPPTAADPRAMAAHDALIGVTLSGRYRLDEKIGQGGMGAVYRASQVKLDRACAIKILPYELASNEQLVARLRQEARATAQLDVTNIVTIYDVDRDPALGIEYLAMELLQGQPLDELLEVGPTPWRKAVELVRQAAIGLGAAHAKGIIHRDVKPANLMCTHGGTVKVMDFGLARLAAGASHLSRTGQLLGTPHFMSPEQAKGEELDARTDIYSLGVTLYVLATGKAPFHASNPAAVLLKVLEERPKPAHEANPDVPRPLAAVIGRMMAKDADRRYPTMAAVVGELDRLLAGEAVGATLSTLRIDAIKPEHKRGAALAAGALVLLCVGLVVGSALSGGSSTPDGGEGSPTTTVPAHEQAYAELSRAIMAGLSDEEAARRCRAFLVAHEDSPNADSVRKLLASVTQGRRSGSDGSDAGSGSTPALLAAFERARTSGNETAIIRAAKAFLAAHPDHSAAARVRQARDQATALAKTLGRLRQAVAKGDRETRDRLRAELLRQGVSKDRLNAILKSASSKPNAAALRATIEAGKLDEALEQLEALDGRSRKKLRDVEADLRLALAERALKTRDASEAETQLDAFDDLGSRRNRKRAMQLRGQLRDLALSAVSGDGSDTRTAKADRAMARRDLRAKVHPALARGDLDGARAVLAAARKGEHARALADDLAGFEEHVARLARLPAQLTRALDKARQAKAPARAIWSTLPAVARITAVSGDRIDISLQPGASTTRRISKLTADELVKLATAVRGVIQPLALATHLAYSGAAAHAEAVIARVMQAGLEPDALLLEIVAPPPRQLDFARAWEAHARQLSAVPRSKLAGVPWSTQLGPAQRDKLIATDQGGWEPLEGGLRTGHGLALAAYRDIMLPEVTVGWHLPRDRRAGASAMLAIVLSRTNQRWRGRGSGRRGGGRDIEDLHLLCGINLARSTMFVMRYPAPGEKPLPLDMRRAKVDLHAEELRLRVVHFEGGMTFTVYDGKGEPESMTIDRRKFGTGRKAIAIALALRAPAKVGVVASNVRADIKRITLKAGR